MCDLSDPYGVFWYFYEIEACESDASRSRTLQKYWFFIGKMEGPGAGPGKRPGVDRAPLERNWGFWLNPINVCKLSGEGFWD